MIDHAEFVNFKALRRASVDLNRFTVFVGPNAAGKSSVLEGLFLAARSSQTRLDGLLSDQRSPSTLRSRNGIGPTDLTICEGSTSQRLRIFSPEERPQSLAQGALTIPGEGEWVAFVIGNGGAGGEPTTPIVTIPEHRRLSVSAHLLDLHGRRLALPSYSDALEPLLRPDGTGLASVLAHTKLKQPEAFRRIEEDLRTVIPSVVRLRFDRVRIRFWNDGEISYHRSPTEPMRPEDRIGEEILFDMQGASDIPASAASNGTLFVLGLLAVAAPATGRTLVLLDDIDHGLHPKAQRDLVAVLRRLLQLKPDLQIVATSHSPYFLDSLEPEEIRLMMRAEDGSAVCARLVDHPLFEKWKDEMAPGEFWSMVGEKWVTATQAQEVGS